MIGTNKENGRFQGSSLPDEVIDSLTIEQIIQRGESIRDTDTLKSANKYIESTGLINGIKALHEASAVWAQSGLDDKYHTEEILIELGYIHDLPVDLADSNTWGRLEAIEDMKRKTEITRQKSLH